MFTLIEQLTPADRQLILLYLEGLTADANGQVAGLQRELDSAQAGV